MAGAMRVVGEKAKIARQIAAASCAGFCKILGFCYFFWLNMTTIKTWILNNKYRSNSTIPSDNNQSPQCNLLGLIYFSKFKQP